MKILRLDLRAFGPFSDLVLNFETQANFHIIYGPNEAGKSSALRALSALFFGIPHNTQDTFLHTHKKLRLGALLQHSDGSTLEFWRRKARIASLYQADDQTSLEEHDLRKYLGGVDQALFSTMFGLDRETLAKGGQEILQGSGRLGQLLFAAGTGIAHLKSVQDSLRSESEDLFKPTGKLQRINKAIVELRETRETVKGHQLTLEAWAQHDEALREAQEKRQHLQSRLDQLRLKEQKLTRLRDALPILKRRREILDELEPFAAHPLLPEDFGEKRRALETDRHLAQQQQRDAKQTLEELERQLDQLELAEHVLEHQDAIEHLHRRLGEFTKQRRERPIRQKSREAIEKEINELEQKLGNISPEALSLESEEIFALRHLGNQFPRLQANLENARTQVADLERKYEELQREWKHVQQLPEVGPLRKLVRQIQPHLVQERELGQLRKQLADLERNVAGQFAKLGVKQRSPRDLARLQLPAADVIERFQSEWDKNAQRQQVLEQQSHQNEKARTEVDAHLGDIHRGSDIPTQGDLREARRERDETWQAIRAVWLDKARSRYSPAKLAEAFEHYQTQVDQLAERLWRESERVGRKMELLDQKEKLETTGQKLIHQLVEIRTRQERLEGEWGRIWRGLDLEPRRPAEMSAWIHDHASLMRDLGQTEEMRKQIVDLEEKLQTVRAGFRTAFAESLHSGNGSDSLLALAEHAQEYLDGHETQERRRGEVQRLRQANDLELEQARHRLQQLLGDSLTWQSQWRPSMLRIGLPEDATPDDAEARLELRSHWSAKRKEHEEHSHWLASLNQELHDFHKEIETWTRRLHLDDPGDPIHAVEAIYALLKKARASQEKYHTLHGQKEQLQRKLHEAEEAYHRSQGSLRSLCQEFGADSHEMLPALEQRSSQRRHLERELTQLDLQIQRLRDQNALDDMPSEIEARKIDHDLDHLERECRLLSQQVQDLDETIGSERAELGRMDGDATAAEIAQRAELLSAQLVSDVEQYVVLRMASGILQESIDAYRQKNESTIIQRAIRLFRKLTVESFEGLEIDPNEKGELVLFGVRSEDRTPIGVEAMSDGARDQLFLALRLASLEAYLEKHEPMPLVVDDLLLHFDNDRALAALKAMMDLSQRTQVLFFTHHRHLVELVEKNLPRQGVHFHHLQGKGTSKRAVAELF